jgi:hypothetical protein
MRSELEAIARIRDAQDAAWRGEAMDVPKTAAAIMASRNRIEHVLALWHGEPSADQLMIRDLEMAYADSLDAAWAAAEAALPEGWHLSVLGGMVRTGFANGPTTAHAIGATTSQSAVGDTPAAALQALAIRIKESRS